MAVGNINSDVLGAQEEKLHPIGLIDHGQRLRITSTAVPRLTENLHSRIGQGTLVGHSYFENFRHEKSFSLLTLRQRTAISEHEGIKRRATHRRRSHKNQRYL